VSSFSGSRSGSSRFRSDRFRTDRFRNRGISRSRDFGREELPELTAEEARIVFEAQAGAADAAEAARRVATRFAATYVTAIQRLNRIVVRSSDPQLMQDIRALIQRLDVPTPLVLLEVRILRVNLSDGLDRGFDFAFQVGDAQGAFTTGEIAEPAAGSILPGGTGVNLSAGVFQVVSDDVQARLQLLQSKGRLTSLASPILLTANGEVSRIFSGEDVPIVTGFTEPQVIVGDGATTTLTATPVTEVRSVGTDLLITANINADRTVTLRLLQETSRVNPDGATILVPTGPTFTSQTIDTVQSQSASGTIVARDGLVLAFGGLIEETESDQREQVPVLGDLPLIGFFFSRESSVISRAELVVLVRPFVLSTPVETDQISRNLLESLSIHPYRPGAGGRSGEADDWGVFQDQQPPFNRTIFDQFRFHTVPSFSPGAAGGGAP
jgi:general secretion pathway protein D